MLRLRFTVLVFAFVAVSPAAQETLHAAADRARDKIATIIATGEKPPRVQAATARTVLTEVELNAYLQVHGPEFLPPGIARPVIRLDEDGRVQARAIVDLTSVRNARPRDWRDPLAYVAGSVEVIASGRILADAGIGRVELHAATVGGVSVPASVVDQLIRFHTATEDRPDGFGLEESFELPANIRRVVVERSRATIVQ
jgi:hypothetical protein